MFREIIVQYAATDSSGMPFSGPAQMPPVSGWRLCRSHEVRVVISARRPASAIDSAWRGLVASCPDFLRSRPSLPRSFAAQQAPLRPTARQQFKPWPTFGNGLAAVRRAERNASALSRIDPGLLRLTDPPTLFPPFVTRCASRGDERAAASGCVGADGDMHTVG